MSVYLARRKDGTLKSPYWQFDFVLKVNGERRRFHGSTGETKEKDARAFVAREKMRLKSQGPRDDMTLAAACYLYDQEVSQHRSSGDDMAPPMNIAVASSEALAGSSTSRRPTSRRRCAADPRRPMAGTSQSWSPPEP
jgi:hypothetical protein